VNLRNRTKLGIAQYRTDRKRGESSGALRGVRLNFELKAFGHSGHRQKRGEIKSKNGREREEMQEVNSFSDNFYQREWFGKTKCSFLKITRPPKRAIAGELGRNECLENEKMEDEKKEGGGENLELVPHRPMVKSVFNLNIISRSHAVRRRIVSRIYGGSVKGQGSKLVKSQGI